jgi:secreted trypsin-like serine protease
MYLPIISLVLFAIALSSTNIIYAQECGVTYATQNAARQLHMSPLLAEARSANLTNKIVGGNVAESHSWPAQALLYVSNGGSTSLCGGTLIATDVVLTAAHCILSTNPGNYRVYLGVQDRSSLTGSTVQQMTVTRIHKHSSYSSSTLRNDIATLVFSGNAILNQYVQLACLPSSSSSSYPSSSQSSWVAGWGTTSSGGSTSSSLRNVRVTVLANSQCSSVYSSSNSNEQVCAGEIAGGKDSCQGDSGGPLYVSDTVNGATKFVVAGVVSYGKGCAQAGYPGVYTRTSYYKQWIADNKGSSTLRLSTQRLFNTEIILTLLVGVMVNIAAKDICS